MMRTRLVQLGMTLVLAAILVQVVLIAPSRIRDTEQKAALIPEPEMKPDGDVDQSMRGMHMIETLEGAKEWELWADFAKSLRAKDMLELETVKAIFFSDSGVTFTVTGARGMVQTKSKNLRVEGDVVVRSSNGYVFRTHDMNYDSANRILTTASALDMVGPKDESGQSLKLRGQGLDANLTDSRMEVLRDVRAEKALDRGRTVQIKSRRAVFSGKRRTAEFLGDVVLDMDAMRITGPAAEFEYDGDSERVKAVSFTGGARVSDADKWATAQTVRVDFDKDRFVFRGSPRVVQNNDELRGEEIIFYDGGKRVQVQRARAKVDQKQMEKVN